LRCAVAVGDPVRERVADRLQVRILDSLGEGGSNARYLEQLGPFRVVQIDAISREGEIGRAHV